MMHKPTPNTKAVSGAHDLGGSYWMRLPDDHLEVFLDASPDAMVIVDQSGRIAFANTPTEAMFGYARSALVGRPIELLLPERFRDGHGDHIFDDFLSPKRTPAGAQREVCALRRDGTGFPVEISLGPVTTGRGTLVSVAIRDITRRKRAERDLIERRQRAEEANRAKSEFLAAVSHDLRQPLQTLKLLTDVLKRTVSPDTPAAAAISSQSAALDLMGEFLDSLLDIRKFEGGAVKPDFSACPLQEILDRLQAEFADVAIAKGLELSIDDSELVVHSDPMLLTRIIQNLLGNAIRYTSHGGVRVRCLEDSDFLKIVVSDTGVGIAAPDLDRIFDEFYQRHDQTEPVSAEGAGLGLAIARRMAGVLGCGLDVESIAGKGSCFTLTVPRCESVDTRQGQVRETGLSGRPSIVVIDDDPAIGEATALLLASIGLDTLVAATADRALEKLGEAESPPGLLICDYHLGDERTGPDAIREIRAGTGLDLPAILISGDLSSRTSQAVSETADCHLLRKPVVPARLIELTETLLGSRTTERSAA